MNRPRNRWILLLFALAVIAAPLKSQTIKTEGGLISGAASATPRLAHT